MSSPEKTLNRILSGQADANIDFADLVRLLNRLGFTSRVKGSQHIFHQTGIEEILNLQPKARRRSPTR